MSADFLSRWSKRKLASRLAAATQSSPTTSHLLPRDTPPAGAAAVLPAGETRGDTQPQGATAADASLPPVSELTLASDFTAFLKEEVSEALRRQALQKLFADPHFNRMDGLDIYIDDYSVADPIPPAMMEKLKHAREWLGDASAETETEAARPLAPVDPVGALVPEDEPGADAPVEAQSADARPADARPAEARPAEARPAEARPAEAPAASPSGGDTA